jgi:SAM-dependent methyltransferase/uncharacterized protein YbaR (Trm112 family)
MRQAALSHFTSPELGLAKGARLDVSLKQGEHVIEGVMYAAEGAWYPIIKGVPCFLTGPLRPDQSEFADRHGLLLPKNEPVEAAAVEQSKTNATFSDKWRRFKNYGHAREHQGFLFDWYCKKLGLPDLSALKDFYRAKSRVLEVGPGSGFNTKFIAENCPGEVFGLDVSDAALTTFEHTHGLDNCTIVQADLMLSPFPDAHFDFIIADGVLHHTPDTREAVRTLYRKLVPGGQMFFYVYKKMGAVRYFSDQHIREAFMTLPPEECYAACEGITELGRELSKIGGKITLDKGIPVLGIPAGTHDVQRLLYYNFVKCFWNDAFDYETNNMVNFDWYHPHNAWQHSQTEVEGWLKQLGATDYSFQDANPNGISALVRKPG